jgi:tRNA dimethylallyltransferase
MTHERRSDPRPAILTVVGPTAVGKTALAITLARAAVGEIVSADSRQIYRGMDIGTAKPTQREQAQARHHLIDIVEPSERYDAARFASDAADLIDGMHGRGVVPVVAGGTGFYLRALFDGLFEGAGRFPETRRELEARAEAEGSAALHAELADVDPELAAKLHPNDRARVVRGLEVFRATGRRLSAWHGDPPRCPSFAPRYVGLRLDREQLRQRIDRRVDAMMAAGLVAEIEALVASGKLSSDMPAASAVGYRELLPIVESGEGGLAEAVELIKVSTRRYAKRQMTWFRAIDGVEWFDADAVEPEELARTLLAGN